MPRRYDISVVLCTYNRCDLLPDAIERLLDQEQPDGLEYEVIVVDNNSTDGTRPTLERYADRTGARFRHVFEPPQGR
jgi:glycosyltransferase involved in cell wall biosynthesis